MAAVASMLSNVNASVVSFLRVIIACELESTNWGDTRMRGVVEDISAVDGTSIAKHVSILWAMDRDALLFSNAKDA
jgi:hypothetical protein